MEHRTTKFTGFLAFLVFFTFALCVLLVLLTGAGVYRKLVRRGEESFEGRTAVQYIATRVRQAEAVSVEDFQGAPALVLGETIGEERYVTRVYCYEGHLRELFSAETAALSPEDGEAVLPLDSATFTLEDNLLRVEAGARELYLHLREGALP